MAGVDKEKSEKVAMGQGVAINRRLCVWCDKPISWFQLKGRWLPMVEGKLHLKCAARRELSARLSDAREGGKVKRSTWGRGNHGRHRSASR